MQSDRKLVAGAKEGMLFEVGPTPTLPPFLPPSTLSRLSPRLKSIMNTPAALGGRSSCNPRQQHQQPPGSSSAAFQAPKLVKNSTSSDLQSTTGEMSKTTLESTSKLGGRHPRLCSSASLSFPPTCSSSFDPDGPVQLEALHNLLVEDIHKLLKSPSTPPSSPLPSLQISPPPPLLPLPPPPSPKSMMSSPSSSPFLNALLYSYSIDQTLSPDRPPSGRNGDDAENHHHHSSLLPTLPGHRQSPCASDSGYHRSTQLVGSPVPNSAIPFPARGPPPSPRAAATSGKSASQLAPTPGTSPIRGSPRSSPHPSAVHNSLSRPSNSPHSSTSSPNLAYQLQARPRASTATTGAPVILPTGASRLKSLRLRPRLSKQSLTESNSSLGAKCSPTKTDSGPASSQPPVHNPLRSLSVSSRSSTKLSLRFQSQSSRVPSIPPVDQNREILMEIKKISSSLPHRLRQFRSGLGLGRSSPTAKSEKSDRQSQLLADRLEILVQPPLTPSTATDSTSGHQSPSSPPGQTTPPTQPNTPSTIDYDQRDAKTSSVTRPVPSIKQSVTSHHPPDLSAWVSSDESDEEITTTNEDQVPSRNGRQPGMKQVSGIGADADEEEDDDEVPLSQLPVSHQPSKSRTGSSSDPTTSSVPLPLTRPFSSRPPSPEPAIMNKVVPTPHSRSSSRSLRSLNKSPLGGIHPHGTNSGTWTGHRPPSSLAGSRNSNVSHLKNSSANNHLRSAVSSPNLRQLAVQNSVPLPPVPPLLGYNHHPQLFEQASSIVGRTTVGSPLRINHIASSSIGSGIGGRSSSGGSSILTPPRVNGLRTVQSSVGLSGGGPSQDVHLRMRKRHQMELEQMHNLQPNNFNNLVLGAVQGTIEPGLYSLLNENQRLALQQRSHFLAQNMKMQLDGFAWEMIQQTNLYVGQQQAIYPIDMTYQPPSAPQQQVYR